MARSIVLDQGLPQLRRMKFLNLPLAEKTGPGTMEMPAESAESNNSSEFTEGGHFPAMEEPNLLADDIRTFFRSIT